MSQRRAGSLLPLGPGVPGFPIAPGNFVFLFCPLGSEAVDKEVIPAGSRWPGLRWACAGFCLRGAPSGRSGPQAGGAWREAPQDTQRAGALSAGPVASVPSPVWSHVGGQTHRRLCLHFRLLPRPLAMPCVEPVRRGLSCPLGVSPPAGDMVCLPLGSSHDTFTRNTSFPEQGFIEHLLCEVIRLQ